MGWQWHPSEPPPNRPRLGRRDPELDRIVDRFDATTRTEGAAVALAEAGVALARLIATGTQEEESHA